ncbi:hypothetical protein CLV80_103128 [Yoonia maritima]|uniref:Uncharacterized protein n=1 Tax=Yoonia maritima TaxID=1435347 RepID=A0A2T0W1I9_9RHOB|nr:hypothetical protein CLV80_103128 [Yoonia maritima]
MVVRPEISNNWRKTLPFPAVIRLTRAKKGGPKPPCSLVDQAHSLCTARFIACGLIYAEDERTRPGFFYAALSTSNTAVHPFAASVSIALIA